MKIICPRCGSTNYIKYNYEFICFECDSRWRLYENTLSQERPAHHDIHPKKQTEKIITASERPARGIPEQKDQRNSRSHRSRIKQLSLFVFVFIIGLMVGYSLGYSSTNQMGSVTLTDITSTTPNSDVINSTKILIKSLDLIPTEYRVSRINGNLKLNLTGFLDGANMSLAKSDGLGTVARIRLYVFKSPSHATNYMQEEVSLIKEKRGYTDLTAGLGYEDCFAWGIKYLLGSQANVICAKGNYYISIQVITYDILELAIDDLPKLLYAIYKNLT